MAQENTSFSYNITQVLCTLTMINNPISLPLHLRFSRFTKSELKTKESGEQDYNGEIFAIKSTN